MEAGLKLPFKTSFFAYVVIIFILSGCGGGNSSDNLVIDTLDSSHNSSPIDTPNPTDSLSPKFQYADLSIKIGNTDRHIIGILTSEGESDSIGIVGEIDSNGTPTSISSLLFISESGESGEFILGSNGLPESIIASDNSKIEFRNYTSDTVDTSIYDQNGFLVYGPITQNIDPSLKIPLLEAVLP